MKRLILMLIVLSLVAPMAMAGVPQKKPAAPKRENFDMVGWQLWGNIDNVIFYDYYPGDNGEWEFFCTSIYTFTEWGDVHTFEFYDANGELGHVKNHIYDEQERTIEIQEQWDDESESTYATFAEDGTAEWVYPSGTKVTERYNDRGDVVYRHTFNSATNTAETEEFIYHYDGENKVFCEYLVNGESVRRTLYGYDQIGNPTYEYRYFSDDEQPDLKFVYHNDKRGNCVEELWYNSKDVEFQRYVNKFDKQGNIIETLYYSEGSNTPDRKLVVEIAYR